MTKQNHRSSNGEPCFEAMRHFEVGLAAIDRCDLDKAIAEFTKAIRRSPKFTDAYGYRAVAYREKGEYDKAVADLTEAIRLEPQLKPAYYDRAAAYFQMGEYDQAIADYTSEIQLEPRFAPAYCDRAALYAHIGKYDEAITDCTSAIQLDPTNPDVYNNRGNRYRIMGDYDRHRTEKFAGKSAACDPSDNNEQTLDQWLEVRHNLTELIERLDAAFGPFVERRKSPSVVPKPTETLPSDGSGEQALVGLQDHTPFGTALAPSAVI